MISSILLRYHLFPSHSLIRYSYIRIILVLLRLLLYVIIVSHWLIILYIHIPCIKLLVSSLRLLDIYLLLLLLYW